MADNKPRITGDDLHVRIENMNSRGLEFAAFQQKWNEAGLLPPSNYIAGIDPYGKSMTEMLIEKQDELMKRKLLLL